MLKRLTLREKFNQLTIDYEPKVRKAFLDAVNNIRSKVMLRRVVESLERGDVNGAVTAMNLEPEAFSQFEAVLAEAYNAGGQSVVNSIAPTLGPDGSRLVFRWGVRNLSAENNLSTHSANLVTRIVEDQRNAIRSALTEGLTQGNNPRTVALDIVGRVSPVTKRREGGIIGLSGVQERYLANARRELLSGDETQLRAFLERERRDKRFDKTILEAIRSKKPLSKEAVNRIIGRYSDRLLQLRGEMIARTEVFTALGNSRDEAFQQQVASGKLLADDVTKTWRSAHDKRVRDTHAILDGHSVALNDVFHSVSGAVLRFPGDPSAPASEIIQCRCWCEYKIDYAAALVRRRGF